MDQQIPPQQQPPVSQPTPPVQQPVAPHNAPLKNQRLLWILAGVFVLLIGIGIGMFLLRSPHKTSQSSQSVNQNSAPQANTSMAPVSSINMAAYPTVSQSSLPLGD